MGDEYKRIRAVLNDQTLADAREVAGERLDPTRAEAAEDAAAGETLELRGAVVADGAAIVAGPDAEGMVDLSDGTRAELRDASLFSARFVGVEANMRENTGASEQPEYWGLKSPRPRINCIVCGGFFLPGNPCHT